MPSGFIEPCFTTGATARVHVSSVGRRGSPGGDCRSFGRRLFWTGGGAAAAWHRGNRHCSTSGLTLLVSLQRARCDIGMFTERIRNIANAGPDPKTLPASASNRRCP